MIEVAKLKFYGTWMKELHGHLVRIDGAQRMIIFIPKEEMIILSGGLESFLTDTEPSFTRSLHDQNGTILNIIKRMQKVGRKKVIMFDMVISSGVSVVMTSMTQDQFETLLVNLRVVIDRDIEKIIRR